MTTVKRKRGGQPGNQNALKHGLYRGQKEKCSSNDRGAQPGNLNALKHGRYSRQIQDLRETEPEIRALVLEVLGMEADGLRLEALELLERVEEAGSLGEAALLLERLSAVAGRIGARELMRALAVRRGNPFKGYWKNKEVPSCIDIENN